MSDRGIGDIRRHVGDYFDTLNALLTGADVTRLNGETVALGDGFAELAAAAHKAHDAGNKVIFIGNGGSAGIASHLAIDFSKNGGMRSLAFNDSSALTCLGNDYGYEHVFAKQIEFHGRPGDLLIAISSSGGSKNILNAVAAARSLSSPVFTFSGFKADNPLRKTGDVNFFVHSDQYGFVEVAHLALIHAALDLDLGWRKSA
jgi:D-sedoheptulose 7-phosphate isomerase